MSFLISLFVVLHMICWAVALGTWVASARTRVPNKGMAHATAGALVFGIVLAALVSIGGDPNHMKLGIKAAIGIVVFVMALIGRRKINSGESVGTGVAHAVGGMALINILVAVFI